MRILHCITGLTPDGAQRMLARLARGLARRGAENCIVSLSGPEPFGEALRDMGFPVYYLNMRSGIPHPRALFELRNIAREFRPHVLQGWMYHANVALTLASRWRKHQTPLLWNIRRGLDDASERKLSTRMVISASAKLSGTADHIIYCSDKSREQHEAIGFRSRSASTIGNGFDSSTFSPDLRARQEFLLAHRLPNDALIVGNVGRADVAKGRKYLLEAFARIVPTNPSAYLVLAGRGVDVSNTEIRELVSRLGIAAHVLMLGERRDVNKLYPAFDIYCSSSIAEGFPNVVAEAMSSGVPCVATDTGATAELLADSGLLVPSRDSESLAKALTCLLNVEPSERRRVGEIARARIVGNYSIDGIVTRYANIYEAATTMHGALSESSRPASAPPELKTA